MPSVPSEKSRILYSSSPLPAYSINPTNYRLSPDDPYAPQHGGINADPSDMAPISPLVQGSTLIGDADHPGSQQDEINGEGEKIFEPHARKPFIPEKNSALAFRMRYYNKLSGAPEATEEEKRHFEVPAHVIPSEIFFPDFSSIRSFFGGKQQPEVEVGDDGEIQVKESKRGDIALIFSIWNTMMGSSLLALPWGFTQSGFAGGLLIIFIIGFFCCYTCVLILKHGKDSADFFYLCNDYLGFYSLYSFFLFKEFPRNQKVLNIISILSSFYIILNFILINTFSTIGKVGKWLCWASSLAILVGGLIAYDILMSDTLFSSGVSIADIIKTFANNPNWDVADTGTHWYWNEKVTPLIIFVVMYPICNMKSFSVIVMINSFGVIPIIYTVLFIVCISFVDQGLTFTNIPVVSKD